MESILQHLSACLSYDMSPRAFLEKYLVTSPVLQVRGLLSWAGIILLCHIGLEFLSLSNRFYYLQLEYPHVQGFIDYPAEAELL